MSDHHLITPPPELVQKLRNEAPHGIRDAGVTRELCLIAAAYRAGADQELEACCEWLGRYTNDPLAIFCLRDARRPKLPTPKEKALQVVEKLIETKRIVDPEYQALRHALEALPE